MSIIKIAKQKKKKEGKLNIIWGRFCPSGYLKLNVRPYG